MNGRYSRAAAVGLAFGLLLLCCNALAYLWYEKQMDDYWTNGLNRYYDNLCVGVDTYFYLIVPTAVLFALAGICCVAYARPFLARRVDASRAAMLAGTVAAVLSLAGIGFAFQVDIIPVRHPYGAWMVIYGIYALGGIFLAMLAGVYYYKLLCHSKIPDKR